MSQLVVPLVKVDAGPRMKQSSRTCVGVAEAGQLRRAHQSSPCLKQSSQARPKAREVDLAAHAVGDRGVAADRVRRQGEAALPRGTVLRERRDSDALAGRSRRQVEVAADRPAGVGDRRVPMTERSRAGLDGEAVGRLGRVGPDPERRAVARARTRRGRPRIRSAKRSASGWPCRHGLTMGSSQRLGRRSCMTLQRLKPIGGIKGSWAAE